MSDARRKSSGIRHTTTVTLLIAAIIFSLPVLAVSLPFGTALFSLAAMACMTVSVSAHSRSLQTIGTVE
jgi:predicted membrane channel-forming protein YqfA (hemolysin III family)